LFAFNFAIKETLHVAMRQLYHPRFHSRSVKEDLKSTLQHRAHAPAGANGYLHIGHTKALIIDFGIAQEFGGVVPALRRHESPEDVGMSMRSRKTFAGWASRGRSDSTPRLLEQLYRWPLIKKGKAYVDDQSPEEVSATRAH
jgi:glutaminyl-tRNA synthetase